MFSRLCRSILHFVSCDLQKWEEKQQSEMVMNPKQVFLSLLIFGVAGLLLFMYLQVWIEEQHTGRAEKKREQKATSEWGPVKYLQPEPIISEYILCILVIADKQSNS
ncbi:carbohydrate sulfotransferase 9-like [Rhynchocyon petersi]